ncbi:MAG: PUA domain-containing protein, partial [Thermoplasmata archaeon]
PVQHRDGTPILWECPTPVGPVPLELLEVYPVGCWVGPEEFEPAPEPTLPSEPEPPIEDEDPSADRALAWSARQVAALLEWQYGADAVGLSGQLLAERTRSTGRLRSASGPGARWFIFGPGAVPRPTWQGAHELHRVLPYPCARIVVDPDAAPFVARGKSLFSQFVRGGDSSLAPDSPALLVDPDDHLLAVGRLLLAPFEMGRMERGIAVRVTAHARATGDETLEEPAVGEPD